MSLMSVFTNPQLWASTLAMTVPLALPAIGGTFSERTGVVNIAMEGIMLIGAFFAVVFSYWTGSAWIGLLLALLMGAIISAVFAWAAIHLNADQVVLGMSVNIFAAGLTAFLLNTLFGYNGTPVGTPQLPVIKLQFLQHIPVLGPLLYNQNVLVYVMIVIVALAHWFLFHTRLGLRMRAVGENPLAADTAGLNVRGLRYGGVIIGGVLSALGGAYLSIGILSMFDVNMTAGRGYIALAAMIFGKWTPLGAFGASILFGFATALNIALQGSPHISSNIISMLPYVLTILALTGLVGRSIPPAADGIPYDPQR